MQELPAEHADHADNNWEDSPPPVLKHSDCKPAAGIHRFCGLLRATKDRGMGHFALKPATMATGSADMVGCAMLTNEGTSPESRILERVVAPESGGFSAEAARGLLTLKMPPDDVRRMEELAEKSSPRNSHAG
jgi:hypothetical protein